MILPASDVFGLWQDWEGSVGMGGSRCGEFLSIHSMFFSFIQTAGPSVVVMHDEQQPTSSTTNHGVVVSTTVGRNVVDVGAAQQHMDSIDVVVEPEMDLVDNQVCNFMLTFYDMLSLCLIKTGFSPMTLTLIKPRSCLLPLLCGSSYRKLFSFRNS